MLRRYETIYSPAIGRHMQLLVFGHFGRPLVAFPSGGGHYYDFEDNGMIDAISHLIDAGRVKVYCPQGLDHESWLNHEIDPHWRAVRHGAYQDFVVNNLAPAIRHDCRTPDIKIGATGCSLGAFHAVNFALKFPDIFPYALCMSGRYDLEDVVGASNSTEVYFNNPIAYVAQLRDEGLEPVRSRAHLILVCGQGAWEEKCLRDTHRLADLLAEKQISHQREIWGHDVEHHWYWWRKQIAHYLGVTLG